MKILFVGDIYGQLGVDYLIDKMPYLKKEYRPNMVIVNAENAANGRGITHKIYKQLMHLGITLISMGNHTWKHHELAEFIETSNIVKPLNDGVNLGVGYKVMNYNGQKLLFINALGSVYMDQAYPLPFTDIEKIIDEIDHDYAMVDFHAEVTSEKIALGHFLDGKASVIVGTHTHVQTNDARMLPKGTLYITDVGMTGALNGVIGVDKDIIVDRFLNGYSKANVVASGLRQLNAVIIDLGHKPSIKTIHLEESDGSK